TWTYTDRPECDSHTSTDVESSRPARTIVMRCRPRRRSTSTVNVRTFTLRPPARVGGSVVRRIRRLGGRRRCRGLAVGPPDGEPHHPLERRGRWGAPNAHDPLQEPAARPLRHRWRTLIR